MDKFVFKGKITHIGAVRNGQTGAGKEWSSRDFRVEEVADKYPMSAKFSMFKMAEHQKYVTGFEDTFAIGDMVDVEFKLEAPDKGDPKIYNNINCWRIDKADGSQAPANDEGPLF